MIGNTIDTGGEVMAMRTEKVVREIAECDKCSHEWEIRVKGIPVQCPKCKNPNWNKGAKK